MSNDLKELETIELTEENIESMVYFIRGQKVMLDFDLARIYGYETRYFNRQVKKFHLDKKCDGIRTINEVKKIDPDITDQRNEGW